MEKKTMPLDLPSFKQAKAPSPGKAITSPPKSVAPPTFTVTPTPAPDASALPSLPKAKRPSLSSHRNDTNATRALDLLTDVETAVTGWHQALRQTLLDIQTLYLAGPIVDGWLEAVPQGAEVPKGREAMVLRHGDAEQVAAYVEKIAQMPPSGMSLQGTQYRLCSLDTDGRMQCQICPPDQLGVISQAIARHQKLRQLVNQKQYLEARLKRAAEALEITRKALDIQDRHSHFD